MNRPFLIAVYIFFGTLLTLRLILSNPQTIPISDENGLGLFSTSVRHYLVNINNQIFQPKTAALVNGVLWGDKSSFSRKDWSLLRSSGLTHIAVASGMNLVLLTGVLTLILPKKRDLNIILSLLIASIYALVTGFQAPIVRALLMLVFTYSATLTGRPSAKFSGLLLAGYILLMISPEQITSISFQLSFMAAAGQLMIPTFTARIIALNRFIISDLTQTVMAQILTLPITVSIFGNYSIASILVNALVLWSVSWIMILGGVAGFVGWLFLPLGRLLALPLEGLSFYFWQVVGYFGSQSWSLVRTPHIDLTVCLSYYLILLGAYLLIKHRLRSG